MHRRARKRRDIRDFSLLPDHGNADVAKASRDQQLLERIDLMTGERHVVELGRIGGEETSGNFVRKTAERIVTMGIPDAEQITPTRRENAIDLGEGFWLVRVEHHAELADERDETIVRDW